MPQVSDHSILVQNYLRESKNIFTPLPTPLASLSLKHGGQVPPPWRYSRTTSPQ